MTYIVVLTKSAARDLRRIDPTVRRRILAALKALENDPRPSAVRKIAGVEDLWRIRMGSYHTVYTISDNKLLVSVVRAAHRREVYRKL